MSIIHFKSKLFKRFHYNPFSDFGETTENLIKTMLKGSGLQTRLHFSKTYLRGRTGLRGSCVQSCIVIRSMVLENK